MQENIRFVRKEDAKAISEIYNYYVEHTIITFDEQLSTVDEMEKKIVVIASSYPFLVYEVDNKIKGYAYVGEWRTRYAFRYTAESTVYLDRDAVGQGIGQKLFEALIEEVRQTPIHALVAFISLPNEASIKLHERLGFIKVAHYNEVGFEFNKWIDLGNWELIL